MSFQGSLNQALGQTSVALGLSPATAQLTEKKEVNKLRQIESTITKKDLTGEKISSEERLDRMGDLAGIYKRIAEINPTRDNYDAYYQLLEDMRTVRENPDVDYSKRFDIVRNSKTWREGAEAAIQQTESPYKLAAEKATQEAMDKLRASTGWIKRNPQTGKFERKKEEK